MKLLAIDDKQDNLIVINALLTNLIPDSCVILARSGPDGIEKAKSEQPDTILLDVKMPGMDGYEVCRTLKADTLTRHIPVIMVTAVHTDSASRIRGLQSGADAFMTKPIDESELVAQVNVALRIKKAEDQLRREKDHLETLVDERTKELKGSEDSFRSLVENSPTGISIVQENRIVYQNPEQERLLSLSSNLPKFVDLRRIHHADVEKLQQFIEAVQSGYERISETDFRFYPMENDHVAANMKWVNCRASRILYQGKDAILINMMDITTTKEMEHLLMMRDKMSSLGRVAAGIAHEIRNPLSGINIYLDTLGKIYQKQNRPEKVVNIIRQIQSASTKIESVVKRVMDFSKPSTPNFVMGEIDRPIQEAVLLSAVTMRKRGVSIHQVLADDLPPCRFDPQLMEQVVMNLISNAAESMKHMADEKRIEITTAKNHTGIIVQISDSGPGIPDNIKNKVFDPFFSTKEGSTGIGLSLCHRIISDHGGELVLSRSKWGGAMFTIKIPRP